MSLPVQAVPTAQHDQLALADERKAYTWTELDPVLNRAVNAMRSLDFGSGPRRIAVYAHNSVEVVIAHVAGILAGVSTVPANFHLTRDEIVYILQDSGAQALFVGPEDVAVGLEAAKLSGISRVFAWRTPAQSGVESFEDWLAAASDAVPPSDQKPLPHMHYTSGTTGRPKATETPPTYFPPSDTVAAYAAIMAERSRALPAGPGLIVGPLYHTGPLTTLRTLIGGTPIVTVSHFDPEQVLATIAKYKVGNVVMVPTHFRRLLSLPADVRTKYDLSSLKRLAHTGAACPPEVKRQMIDWFGPILVEAYGGTEAGSTHMITSDEWLRKPGSVGRAAAPFETVIVDEDGKELGPNEVGQLYIRDTTGRGIIYSGDAEKTAQSHIAPGVFTLGEMAYVDEEGYVFITDRVSDMIVSGGVNIYPAETEHVLLQHDAVADVAVIGAPNEDMGEEVKALVIAKDPANPPTVEALNAFCRQHLAGYKCPRSYEFVTDIGRNAMGKVNKRELRKKYWPSERTIG